MNAAKPNSLQIRSTFGKFGGNSPGAMFSAIVPASKFVFCETAAM